jgi:hypothetical protein
MNGLLTDYQDWINNKITNLQIEANATKLTLAEQTAKINVLKEARDHYMETK